MSGRRIAIYLLIIVSLLTGLLTGKAAFFNVAYLFGALFVLALLWSWLSIRNIIIARKTRTRRSHVGHIFAETFHVRNSSWIPRLWLDVRDHSDLPGHRASHVVPPLKPGDSYEWSIETPCRVRGEFHLGHVTIYSGDPFGLFLSHRRVNAYERVVVYPATVPVDSFFLPAGVLSGGEAQRQLTHQTTTNAAGVRDYVPGDSINRIHWRSTARRNTLIVKEFEIDPLVDIWMFVDLSAQSLVEMSALETGGHGSMIPGGYQIPPSTEEYAIVLAASLARHFLDLERVFGFGAYIPHREFHQPERGIRQFMNIMETLAIAKGKSPYSLQQMLALEVGSFARGTTLVLVTASLDNVWVSEVQILMRRGVRPLCVLIDPSSFGGSQSPDEMKALLRMARIPFIMVQRGDNLTAALRQPPLL